jgi:hypothetical protein
VDSLLVLKWVFSVLSADATLAAGVVGGWHEEPPEDMVSPWGTIYSISQNQDLRADQGAQLIWARPVLQITLWDRSNIHQNYSRIEPLAIRVNQVLNGQAAITVTDGVIYTCTRDFSTHGLERQSDVSVRYLRQQYSFEAKHDQS